MKNKKRLAVIAAISTVITGLIVLLSTLFGQTVMDSSKKGQEEKAQQDTVSKMRSTFPVVDYLQADVQSVDRRAKSRKYGLISVLDPNITDNSSVVIINEWEQSLTALPVEQSQVIVLGTVVGAHAYMSDNKQAVYSEFTIEIEKIFKNETGKHAGVNNTIFAERQGGIVRFPTGFEKWVFIEGQGMPALKKRYLFFLSYDSVGLEPQKSDLSILTAYEISDGRLFPLDSPGGGSHPIATSYTGKPQESIFEDMDRSLKRKNKPAPKMVVQP